MNGDIKIGKLLCDEDIITKRQLKRIIKEEISRNILIEKNMPQNESASFSVSEFGWVPHFQLRFTARSLAAICFLSTSSILPPLSIAADGNFYDGGEIYETHCMRCHGVNLGGGYTKSCLLYTSDAADE